MLVKANTELSQLFHFGLTINAGALILACSQCKKMIGSDKVVFGSLTGD
jgi:hypothetical protein